MPLPVRSKYLVIHGLNGLCFLIFGFLYCFSLLGRFLFFTLVFLFAFEFIALTYWAASRLAGNKDISTELTARVAFVLQSVYAVFLPAAAVHLLFSLSLSFLRISFLSAFCFLFIPLTARARLIVLCKLDIVIPPLRVFPLSRTAIPSHPT